MTEKHETFYSEEEALVCQAQHKGAEITAHDGHGIWLNGEWTYDIPENRPSWTVSWEESETGIEFDPFDLEAMQKLMDEHGDSESPFSGMNENAEEVDISVFRQKIVVKTYQHNGWVRINTYWRDGTREETFDGRWKTRRGEV